MVNVLVNTLVAFLIGGATLSFNFKAVDASGVEVYNGKGEIVTLGEKYRMETDDVVVASDGKVMCIYQKGADELVLQGVDAAGGDIMANPFALLQNGSGGVYKITTGGSDSKGFPKEIFLKAKNGALYTIQILGYSANPLPDSKLFTLSAEDFPTAYVTDMR